MYEGTDGLEFALWVGNITEEELRVFDKISRTVGLLTTIPIFYNLIPKFTVSVTCICKQWCQTQEKLK